MSNEIFWEPFLALQGIFNDSLGSIILCQKRIMTSKKIFQSFWSVIRIQEWEIRLSFSSGQSPKSPFWGFRSFLAFFFFSKFKAFWKPFGSHLFFKAILEWKKYFKQNLFWQKKIFFLFSSLLSKKKDQKISEIKFFIWMSDFPLIIANRRDFFFL